MTVVIILLALSALIGFALGASFSWPAISTFSAGIAVLSSAILHIQGFGAIPGIAIVVACLTVNQLAYVVMGVVLSNRRSGGANKLHEPREKTAEARWLANLK
jgi:hypothetical protein